jgi:hypothetical protein
VKLTDQEFELIRNAQRTASGVRVKTIALVIILGFGFVAFFGGIISSAYFAAVCVAASIGSILLTQLGGPSNQELVALLSKVEANSERIEKDPLIEALTKKS